MDVERRKLLKMLSGAFLANPGIPHVSSYLKASSSNDKMNHTTYDWRTPVKDKSHRKNVILLTFDDLRFDTFSFHGSSAKTPNIDALKNKSVYFSNACTTTELCSPSRAALFTGRLGHRTGLDDNCHVWQSRLMGLSLQQETILEWARQKDYFVGHFGKWHLDPNGPMRRGVHRFSKKAKDFERPRKLPDKPDFEVTKHYYDSTKVFEEKPEYYATTKECYEDTAVFHKTFEAIQFLNEAQQTELPFFMTVSYNTPHPPYKVPKPYNKMYDFNAIKLPKSLNESTAKKPGYQREFLWPWHDVGHMTDDDWRKSTSYYWGSVSMIDKVVGEILDTIRKNGFWENTMIVFIGDQGSMIGEHTLYDKGPYSYDELMRIPLLVYMPGERPNTINRNVSSIDVNKTLTEWMELDAGDKSIDSRSLIPFIENGDSGWSIPDEAFYRYEWYNGKWYGIRAIRTPHYKYCWNPVGINELYDLRNDSEEMNNLIDLPEYRKNQTALEQRLKDHLKTVDDPLFEKMNVDILN